MEALMTAARVLVEADEAVEVAEAALKVAKERSRLLREETLPHTMLELGLTRVDLDSGETLKLAQEVYASIPNDKQAEAFAWLTKMKADGIIKTFVEVEFGKGQLAAAKKVHETLLKQHLPATLGQNVHPSTLKAFLKESMADGIEVPFDLFNAWPVFTTKLTYKKS
jgi:hypothetical protein